MLSRTIFSLLFLSLFLVNSVESSAQPCDAEIDGIFFYCRPENPDSFYVGFHIMGAPGIYDVIDLTGNNPDNRGIRVDDISSDVESASYSIAQINLTIAEPNEYWYFGPYENGMTYDIVIVEQANSCDTMHVDSGSYTCVGKPFTGCTSPDSSDVPFYHIIFTNSHVDSCLIIARPRGLGCGNCTGGMGNNASKRCFEFKIELGPNDFGVEVEDVGSGSPAGELYWAFNKDAYTCDSLIASNPNGLNMSTVCTYDNKVVYMLSCKQGMNATSVSIMDIPSVEAENLMTVEPCDSVLLVTGADKVCWTSPDDPNLDNLLNCTSDSLECTFLYNSMVFGSVTQCVGDTFMYIAAASPLDMVCLDPDTIIYDTSYVVVFPVYQVEITKSCGNMDSVILQANVISAAPSCNYNYEWSDGSTTSSISALADNSKYSVTVTRSEMGNSTDTCVQAIAMDSAFIGLQVTCDLDTIRRECLMEVPSADWSGIMVTTCSGYDSMVVDQVISGTGCNLNPLLIYRHFIYSNLDGMDTCTQVILVEDVTPPTFTAPANMEIPCDGDTSVSSTGMITNAMDNCTGNTVTITYLDNIVPGICPAIDTILRVWSIMDTCGNLAQHIQRITRIDTVPPTFTVPPDTVLNCDLDTLPARTGEIMDTFDHCSDAILVSYRDEIVSGECPATDTIYRWWRAEDQCGNTDSLRQVITRIDTIPPDITCPSIIFTGCEMVPDDLMEIDSFIRAGGSFTDNCGIDSQSFRGILITSSTDVIQRYFISDSCGLTDSCEIVGNIVAAEPPVARCRDTLFLDVPVLGPAVITVDSVDDGSFDVCGIDTMYLSKYEFDCGGLYDQVLLDSVELIVVDDYGLRDTCTTILVLNCGCNPYRPMICYDELSVSLGMECEREFPLELFVAGYDPECTVALEGMVLDYAKRPIGTAININMIGQTLYYKVTNILTNAHCWGKLNVHLGSGVPAIMCRDTTIYCLSPLPPLPEFGKTCEFPLESKIISEKYTPFDCNSGELIGQVTRKIQVKDQWERITTCEQVINLINLSGLPVNCPSNVKVACNAQIFDSSTSMWVEALWHPDYAEIDENGYAHPLPILNELGESVGLVSPPYLIQGGDTLFLTENFGIHCQIFTNYSDLILPTCGNSYKIKRTWEIADWCAGTDTSCIQWIEVMDTVAPRLEQELGGIISPISPHDCNGQITLRRPSIIDDCGLKIRRQSRTDDLSTKVTFVVRNPDGSIPNSLEKLYGELLPGLQIGFKLSPGTYRIHYLLQDPCGFSREYIQQVDVMDDIGPTPVCDRITTTTPDPEGCWSRIAAEDLDDGSFDNCCDSLHFAVAKMTDIDYWTNYWVEAYKVFYGENYYLSNQAGIESEIEHWIECYLFNDYVELTDCGSEMVVLRVYEACGMPQYDPHQFAGSKHNWYCFQVYDDFACYLRLHYDEVTPIDIPRMDLLKASLAKGVDGPVYGSEPNPLDCEYVLASDLDQWVKIQADYPEIVNLSNSRMTFPHHWSQCMVEVLKEDKVAPVVTTAGDVTVYCDGVPLSIANSFVYPGSCDNPVSYPWPGGTNGYYGGPSVGQYAACDSLPWGIQGRYVVDGYNWRPVYCRAWLLMDVYDSPGGRPKFEFGTPFIKDNCTPLDSLQQRELDSGSLNECGVGTMHRVWTVTDRCGNVGTGGQRITTLPRSDFEVIFPTDIEILCNEVMDLSPEGMGGLPIVSDDECELVGINYHDERLNIVEDGCYKILRIWTLVDWCIYEGEQLDRNPDYIMNDSLRAGTNRPCVIRSLKDNGDGYMKYIQVIKVQDQEEPEFTGRTDTVFCSYNENCEPLEISLNLGEGRDNCSRDIRYSYTVYDNMENEVASGTGNELTGVFDLGIYTVAIRIGDGCGNAVTDTVQFAVNDCKAPGVYCTGEIITVIMDTVGSVEVDASIFDLGTLDNCTPQEDLYIGYDDFTTSKVFTCADIPNGISQLIPLTVIFMDEGGNIGSCNVTLNLQDGVGPPCTDAPNLVQLSGKIDIESGEGVEYAEVSVTEMGMVKTDVDGRYAVHNAIFGNRYEVRPERNDDPLNGVSTLDLVLIQKHVLGTELLSSPYKLIAADVNDSKQISALDIVELRKMILGTSTEFEHNMSWRFVDKNYVFPSPQQPWEYPESIKLQDMRVEEMDDLDFVGVKIGDVNGNVKANGLMEVEIREEREKMWFEVDELEYTAEETYEISFYGSAFEDIVGFQGTIELLNLEVLGISRSGLEFDETNVGWRWAASGMLTLSWHDESGVTLDQEEELFTLRVRAAADGKLSESMKVHSRYTPAEAYHSDYTPIDVGVRFRRGDELIEHQSFKLYQNIPNPFFSYTTIGFELPRADVGILRILDMRGKLLYEFEGGFVSGYNEVRVDSKSINSATGVLYYQLETQDHVALKKMIRVR